MELKPRGAKGPLGQGAGRHQRLQRGALLQPCAKEPKQKQHKQEPLSLEPDLCLPKVRLPQWPKEGVKCRMVSSDESY